MKKNIPNKTSSNMSPYTGKAEENHSLPEKAKLYAAVPLELLEDKKIPKTAKVVYMYLLFCAGKDGKCFPKQATIGKATDMSVRTVRRAIAKLVELKVVSAQKLAWGRSNNYELHIERLPKQSGQTDLFNEAKTGSLINNEIERNSKQETKGDSAVAGTLYKSSLSLLSTNKKDVAETLKSWVQNLTPVVDESVRQFPEDHPIVELDELFEQSQSRSQSIHFTVQVFIRRYMASKSHKPRIHYQYLKNRYSRKGKDQFLRSDVFCSLIYGVSQVLVNTDTKHAESEITDIIESIYERGFTIRDFAEALKVQSNDDEQSAITVQKLCKLVQVFLANGGTIDV